MTEHDTTPSESTADLSLETIQGWIDNPETAPDPKTLDEIADQLAAERLALREQAFDHGKKVKLMAALLYRRGYTNQAKLARRLHITTVTMSNALEDSGIPPVRGVAKWRAQDAGITPVE